MSEWEIVYTEGAIENLRGIYEYIAYTLLQPQLAADQEERIIAAIDKLWDFPMRYPLYKHEPWLSRGLRWFPVDKYLVFYHPKEESNTVLILRIFYASRDVRALLNEVEERQ